MITIYNTLSRRKEEFRPLKKGKVKMYVCGPTVYDVPHIGHARSSYIFDWIKRYLEFSGFQVYFVRNITDVDDKIIKKAQTELGEGNCSEFESLREKTREVAERYLEIYHAQMDLLGIGRADAEPKATEYIQDMIAFTARLIKKDYAYVSGGSVYFSVEKFKEYGKLSNRKKCEMISGPRASQNEEKKDPLDFALWKAVKPDEPFWESPWGRGRPGWHIECAVMSTKILGAHFDIHGGGLDLIFPHHENEIAEAQAATGEAFADYWIHNGLLTVRGEKMSKSFGNYITIDLFLKEYEDPDCLKIVFLNSHYRSPIDYNDKKIEEARRIKERIMIFIDKAVNLEIKTEPQARLNALLKKSIRDLREKFKKAMDDDFNTPLAMSVIFETVKKGNDFLHDERAHRDEKAAAAGAFKKQLFEFTDIFGLRLSKKEIDRDSRGEIEKLVAERESARKNRDYTEADRIRKILKDKGIVVEDTAGGSVWRKN